MTDNQNEKEQLLQLIIDQGILHDTPQRPVLARDGKTRLSWVMNFLGISLQQDGLRLAARQLLPLLGTFQGRQLATIGTAAVPLLSACILESDGRYTGLMVRKERKGYGTASLIDGRINHSEPVIVIDDSIGSGTNMLDCISKLEQEGLYVEGCACLVRFGYDSGYALLQERGYRVIALFDQLQDISPQVPRDYRPTLYPVKDSFSHIQWDEQRLADYISPFQAIRDSIKHYWETGRLLRPPHVFNQPLDTSGGLTLSLRAQHTALTSWGRHGFWHFPEENTGENTAAGPIDISHAAWLLACQLQQDEQRQQRLAQGALGLSLFGPLEDCTEAGFDPTLHAIVVRSREAPWKMGGGLPNMPGIQGAAQLLYHVRFQNTRLRPLEPFHLYRHTVEKLVEPGAEWPAGGMSRLPNRWDEQATVIQPIARHLSGWVRQLQQQQDIRDLPLPELYIPAGCQWLFLSVSCAGKLLACAGLPPHNAQDLLRLAQAAAQDPRWQAMQGRPAPLTLRLYFLSEQTWLGETQGLEQIAHFSLGEDAIAIQHEQQFSLILPDVPVQYGWNAAQLGASLYQKAGIPTDTAKVHWLRYRCRKWQIGLDTADTQEDAPCLLTDNTRQYPLACSVSGTQDYAQIYRTFLLGHLHGNGQINGSYNPVLHQVSQQQGKLTTARILYLLGKDGHTPEWQPAFDWLLSTLTDAQACSDSSSVERAYTLLALCGHAALRQQHRALLARQLEQLQTGFDAHGQYPGEGVVSARQHASIEVLALLQARQAGFVINDKLLGKAVWYWLQQARYHALPDQYPLLLETLSLARTALPAQTKAIDTLLSELHARLLRWQLASGAFISAQPHYSPVLFTAEVVNGLYLSSLQDPTLEQATERAITYLHSETIQNQHASYLPIGIQAIGGLHSGLPHYHLLTVCSALALRAERMIRERRT